MTKLSPMASRLLALVLLLGVIAMVGVGVIQPLWHMFQDDRTAIAEHEKNIARFRIIAATFEPLLARLEELERQQAASPNFLAQASPSLAAAALQERVKSTVESTGGDLTSTALLSPLPIGTYTQVTIRVRMSVQNDALQQILHALESGVPHLLVDNLSVVARALRLSRGNRAGEPPLDVRFELSGIMYSGQG